MSWCSGSTVFLAPVAKQQLPSPVGLGYLVTDITALTHYMWLMQMAAIGAAICISLATGNGECAG